MKCEICSVTVVQYYTLINVYGRTHEYVCETCYKKIATSSPPLGLVAVERHRQDQKWGAQDHPSFSHEKLDLVDREAVLGVCKALIERGETSWDAVLLEEVCEALAERDDAERLERELVQVAAVCVAWVECLRRRQRV